jgi:hypothetical protein
MEVGDEAEASPDRQRSGLVAGRPNDRVRATGARPASDLPRARGRKRDAPPHDGTVAVLVRPTARASRTHSTAASTGSARPGGRESASSADCGIHSCGGHRTDGSSSTRPATSSTPTPGSPASTARTGGASCTTRQSRGSPGDLDPDSRCGARGSNDQTRPARKATAPPARYARRSGARVSGTHTDAPRAAGASGQSSRPASGQSSTSRSSTRGSRRGVDTQISGGLNFDQAAEPLARLLRPAARARPASDHNRSCARSRSAPLLVLHSLPGMWPSSTRWRASGIVVSEESDSKGYRVRLRVVED